MADRIHSRGNGPARLAWRQVMARRTERHHLHRRVAQARMLEVIARIGGSRAQLRSSAELSVGARVEGLDPQAIERALWDDRSLVKTWAMRGTLHLLPAAELTLWQAAFNTDPSYLKPFWLRNFGVIQPGTGTAGLRKLSTAGSYPRRTGRRFRGLPVPLN